MASKKIIAGIVPIALAIIGLFATGEGTNWTFDFSSTESTNISGDTTISGDTIINEGDTIINEAVGEFTDDLFDEFVDRGYDYFCEEVEPDSPECDSYWEDP